MVPTAAINLDVNRCLAHIINIAMQALISTRSKAKYYDSSAQEAELLLGDEPVSLVRLYLGLAGI